MHISNSQSTFDKEFKFIQNLPIVNIVLISNFNWVIVMHFHWSTSKISHSILIPFKSDHNRAINKILSLYLNTLSNLSSCTSSFVTTKWELCYESRVISSSIISFKLYLQWQAKLVILIQCIIKWSKFYRKVSETN
jgi:hypothetical protein